MKRRASTAPAELLILLAGAGLLATSGFKMLRYEAFQSHPEWFTVSQSAQHSSSAKPSSQKATVEESEARRIVGRLEIPRLRMSVLVLDGDDENSLSLSAGHVPGTAALGEAGNMVIAGHRDTVFRPLRRVKVGDQVQIRNGDTYLYVVKAVRIVDPDDVEVLRNSDTPMLTMITCYPFGYVGDAPKRYVVQAERLGR